MVSIKSLKCQGLYSYRKEFEINLLGQTIIVGPNNSGKSTIFKLVKLLVDTLFGNPFLTNNPIAPDAHDPFLEICFGLSDYETEKIIDFLSFYHDNNQKEHFSAYDNRTHLIPLLGIMCIRISWKRPTIRSSEPYMEIDFPKIGLKIYGDLFSSLYVSDHFSEDKSTPLVDTKSKLHDLLSNLSDIENAKSDVTNFFKNRNVQSIQNIKIHVTGSSVLERKTRMLLYQYTEIPKENTEISLRHILYTILRMGIVFSSDSRGTDRLTILDYVDIFKKKLADINSTTKEENRDLLSRYNLELDHSVLVKLSEREKTLYPNGSNLSSFLFDLKNSHDHGDRSRFKKIQDEFESLFCMENLTFDVVYYRNNMPTDTQLKPRIPTIVVHDGTNSEFPVSDVGAGITEVIYLLTLGFGMKDSAILLDEPSINLHPSLMHSVMNSIYDSTVDVKSNQLITISHSVEFVRFAMFEKYANIFYVRKIDNSSTIHGLQKETRDWFQKNTDRLRHQIDPRMFFAKCVILTEGESDKNLLIGISSQMSNQFTYNLDRNDVVIVSVNGKKNFRKYIDMLESLHIPYLLLADNDALDMLKVKKPQLVNKDTESLHCNVLILEKDLEGLMRNIDSDAYDKSERENPGSKPILAYAFAQQVSSDPKKLTLFKAIFEKAIQLTNS